MRELYRTAAKAAMERAGYSKINRRMRNNQWRRILGIRPVFAFRWNTSKNKPVPIPENYHGPKKAKPGTYAHLLAY